MKKTFCDKCKDEITPDNEMNVNKATMEVELNLPLRDETTVIVHIGNGFSGDICKFCVLDAVAKIDDRPKAAPERPRYVDWDYLAPATRKAFECWFSTPNFTAASMYMLMQGYFTDGGLRELAIERANASDSPPHRSGTTQVNDTPDSMREA